MEVIQVIQVLQQLGESEGYFHIRRSGGGGGWPQNLLPKFLLKPQILPPKV